MGKGWRGGVCAQQLSKTSAGDTGGWHWALQTLRHLGDGDTGTVRKGQFCHPEQVPRSRHKPGSALWPRLMTWCS